MAAIWNLPVIFVVENNAYGMGTKFSRMSDTEMTKKAASHGVRATVVDGQDVMATYAHFEDLIEMVRQGAGPQFVDVECYRFKGHSMSDPVSGTYRSKEEVDDRTENADPIKLLRDRLFAAELKRHPACNAHWLGDSILRFNRVHIGVAVAVEDGLITPIIRDADLKGVAHIGAEVRELAGRAKEKRLQPDEYTGATFSISNLGMFGIHEFTAVINPPEAGILAVGGVEEVPVAEDGQVVIRNRMKMTMSCDHRVIDGALAAAFLATLKEPTAILL